MRAVSVFLFVFVFFHVKLSKRSIIFLVFFFLRMFAEQSIARKILIAARSMMIDDRNETLSRIEKRLEDLNLAKVIEDAQKSGQAIQILSDKFVIFHQYSKPSTSKINTNTQLTTPESENSINLSQGELKKILSAITEPTKKKETIRVDTLTYSGRDTEDIEFFLDSY